MTLLTVNVRMALVTVSFFALSACNRQYSTEKLFWKADQMKAEIARSPDATPPGQYATAREAFEKVIAYYPKSDIAVAAQISIGDLFSYQKDWTNAEMAYRSVLDKFPKSRELEVQVKMAIGHMKEVQGKMSEGVEIYKDIINNYDDTVTALKLPLMLARSKIKKGWDQEKIKALYKDAVTFYAKIQAKYPKTKIASGAMDLLFQCYSDQGMWDLALKELDKIQEEFPNSIDAQRAQGGKQRIIEALKAAETARAKSQSLKNTSSPSEPAAK